MARVVVEVAQPAPAPSDSMPRAAAAMQPVGGVQQVDGGGQGSFARPLPRHEEGGDQLEQSLRGRLKEAGRPPSETAAHTGDTTAHEPLRSRVNGPVASHPSRIEETTSGPPITELQARSGSRLDEVVYGEKAIEQR